MKGLILTLFALAVSSQECDLDCKNLCLSYMPTGTCFSGCACQPDQNEAIVLVQEDTYDENGCEEMCDLKCASENESKRNSCK